MTGHSLGGGLAQAAAVKVGARAVTFNPASVYKPSAASKKLAAGTITNIVVEGEFINAARKRGLTGELLGTTCSYPAATGKKLVSNHLLSTVIAALKAAR